MQLLLWHQMWACVANAALSKDSQWLNLCEISTLKHTTDNSTGLREAQTLAGMTGERNSPYLFISPAPWPKYLAKSQLQKRMTKAWPPCPGLKCARLIKIRLTWTFRGWWRETDWESSGGTFKYSLNNHKEYKYIKQWAPQISIFWNKIAKPNTMAL